MASERRESKTDQTDAERRRQTQTDSDGPETDFWVRDALLIGRFVPAKNCLPAASRTFAGDSRRIRRTARKPLLGETTLAMSHHTKSNADSELRQRLSKAGPERRSAPSSPAKGGPSRKVFLGGARSRVTLFSCRVLHRIFHRSITTSHCWCLLGLCSRPPSHPHRPLSPVHRR